MVETPLPSREADWYSLEDLRKISHAWASGRLVDQEAINRNKANGIFYAALSRTGFDVAFDAMLDAALEEA